jgi:hypothetical protein
VEEQEQEEEDLPTKDPSKVVELDDDAREQLMLEDAVKKRNYILSARSNMRFYWDTIIIIFAIFNGITLPLEIAFQDQITKVSMNSESGGI